MTIFQKLSPSPPAPEFAKRPGVRQSSAAFGWRATMKMKRKSTGEKKSSAGWTCSSRENSKAKFVAARIPNQDLSRQLVAARRKEALIFRMGREVEFRRGGRKSEGRVFFGGAGFWIFEQFSPKEISEPPYVELLREVDCWRRFGRATQVAASDRRGQCSTKNS
jgi:hypothetical protein